MRHKWLVGGLAFSVVLNLLLAGFVAGRLTSTTPFPAYRPDPTVGLYRLIQFLPEPRERELKAMMRTHTREMYPELRQIRRSHRRIDHALKADPFDPEALDVALATLREQLNATQVASHATFSEVAAALTPVERERLAEAMRHLPRPREPRHPPGPERAPG